MRVLARVTPGSARDGVEGIIQTADGAALKVRVRAVAEDGKANRSVETVVAQWLGVAKTRVAVTHGGKSRIKTLDIDGDPGELETLIAARMAAQCTTMKAKQSAS
ncbi:MAG: DUF167 family protein [Hyphomonadaceae bacterium]|nr:DUF167 family protein [Hyphomonadaceae bacterium]